MSKKAVYTLLSTGAFVVIASTSISTFAQGGMLNNNHLQTTLKTGDYSAFKKATKTQNTKNSGETNQQSSKTSIQDRSEIKTLVDSAIKNEDWNSYQTAVATLPIDTLNGKRKVTIAQTEDEFKQLVLKHQLRETIRTAIDEKDWESFSAASQSMQELEPHKDENKHRGAKIPTTEEEFNQMIARRESGVSKQRNGGHEQHNMDKPERR